MLIKLANPDPDQAPAGEVKHEAEAAGAYVPDGQIFLFLSASGVPSVGHAYPAGQSIQLVAPVLEYFPAGHGVHTEPLVAEKVPA